MNDTLERIEALRQSLYALVEQNGGNYLHPAVVAASQRLDDEISNWTLEQGRPSLPYHVPAVKAVI